LDSCVLEGSLGDAKMATVIRRLCELGAPVNPNAFAILDRHLDDDAYVLSKQALRECELAWQRGNAGKITEEEAALYM
jgi:hypothetical protein